MPLGPFYDYEWPCQFLKLEMLTNWSDSSSEPHCSEGEKGGTTTILYPIVVLYISELMKAFEKTYITGLVQLDLNFRRISKSWSVSCSEGSLFPNKCSKVQRWKNLKSVKTKGETPLKSSGLFKNGASTQWQAIHKIH